MAKITVNLKAFHGYSCGFQSHASKETVEIEISNKELDSLKKFGKEKITAEDIVTAIEGGDTTLESLHEQLSEKFYYMVEEYWLYEAYNECLDECLAEHILQDICDGLYTPSDPEDEEDDCCIEEVEDEESDDNYEDLKDNDTEEDDCEDDEDDYYEDEEDDYDNGYDYDLNKYYEWVKEHDHEFVAERVGLDLYACREDEVNYSINLEN